MNKTLTRYKTPTRYKTQLRSVQQINLAEVKDQRQAWMERMRYYPLVVLGSLTK